MAPITALQKPLMDTVPQPGATDSETTPLLLKLTILVNFLTLLIRVADLWLDIREERRRRIPQQKQWGDAKKRVIPYSGIWEGFDLNQLQWLEEWEQRVERDGEEEDDEEEFEEKAEHLHWETYCEREDADSNSDFVAEYSVGEESDAESEDWE